LNFIIKQYLFINSYKKKGFFILKNDIEKSWLNPAQAAEYLNISQATLALWRSKGIGPKYSKPSQKIYYFKDDLDAYIRGE